MRETKPMTARRWRIKSDDLQIQAQQHGLRQSLPEELGLGYSSLIQLDQDLNYIETHYTPSQDLAVFSHIESQEPRVVVTLGLKGNSRFAGNQSGELIFNEGYTTVTMFNSSVGERQYQANQAVIQLRLSIGKNWLDRYFGESNAIKLINNKATQLLSYRPISPQGVIAARQLLTANVPETLRRVFIHAQTLSLLTAELSPFFEEKEQSTEKFNQKDKAIADLARDILVQEFKNPPSIPALSKRVGTNQFKLKQLFHHFFNTTPYGLLLEIRMNNAYQLLVSTCCQVSAAADFVGYQHASNFSSAFIKYFGVSPKAIAKRH
ncbi:MAG: helix-turn-helix transcriptional regulator [Methylovulum sp.]